MTTKRAYGVEEAGAYLGLSASAIRKLIGESKLAARKYGTKTLIDVAELDAYFESLPEAV